ncbi:MAG: hypothetical protein KKD53_00280 [Proteobacteria bacterium]|nr:hypothetical protein [Pseudomonadota bacterium]
MERYLAVIWMRCNQEKHARRFATARPAQILTTFALILTSIFIFLFFYNTVQTPYQ